MSTVKTITIRCEDLGADVQLVLMFDKDKVIPRRSKDIFPTAWRVTTFPKTGRHKFEVKYEPRLVFTKLQVVDDIIQPAATHSEEITNGQATTLHSTMIGGIPSFWFSDPTDDEPGMIKAYNASDSFADIGVGLVEPGIKDPTTILLWKKIGHGESVPVAFTPILSAYIIRESKLESGQPIEDGPSDPSSLLVLNDISENETAGVESTPTLDAYTATHVRENEVIKSQVVTDLNWSENISELRNETDWRLIRDKNTGKFSLIGDDSRF